MSSLNTWLHCNKCYIRFVQHKDFYITKCEHVFCTKCIPGISVNQECPVCKNVGECWQLDNELQQDLSEFFSFPDGSFQEALKMIAFQSRNKDRLLNHLTAKYATVKKEYMKLATAYKAQVGQLGRLKVEIQKMRRVNTLPDASMDVSGSILNRRNRSIYGGYAPDFDLSINSFAAAVPSVTRDP